MKTTTALFTIAILFSVSLISCNKDANTEQNNNNNPNPNPVVNNKMVKWYLIDSSANSQDTTDFTTISYDAQDRVNSISYYGSNAAGAVPYSVVDYYYNSNDTLPYRSYELRAEPDHHDTTNTFFFYDGAGRRIKDSLISSYKSTSGVTTYNVGGNIKLYNYAGGNIIGLSTHVSTNYSSSGTFTYTDITKDTVSLDANGNYINSIKNLNGSTSVVTSCSYNSEANIFSTLNIRKNLDLFPDEYFNFATKNNPLHCTANRTIFSGSTTYNFDYTYTHNSDGLITEILVNNPYYTAGHYDKNIFVYQ